MLRIVQKGLSSDFSARLRFRLLPRVSIARETWEIAARDFYPNPMALSEQVARTTHRNRQFVRSSRLEQFRHLEGVLIFGPQDPLGQIHREIARVDVHQLDGKIGVAG